MEEMSGFPPLPHTVMPRLDPRLSGPLFAYVILRMVNFLPLVVARGSWGGR
jgi:hypothetical protein